MLTEKKVKKSVAKIEIKLWSNIFLFIAILLKLFFIKKFKNF